MTEQEKALLEAAEETKELLWQALEKRLSAEDIDLVRSYLSVFFRAGLLAGTVRPGPEFSREDAREDLEELVGIVRCRVGLLEMGEELSLEF